MVVKKPNGDGKVKNGGSKTTRGKATEANLNLVDKNGNMLPAESKTKRDDKCQVKRQGIKAINSTESKASNNQEIITTYEADDGTIYELDGKIQLGITVSEHNGLIYLALGFFWFLTVNCLSYYCNYL